MTNYVTIGTFGDTSATGWTSFTLPPGASRIYLSYSTGNNSNPGTAASPKQTFNGTGGAASLLVQGRGDHVLYKKGDTWPDSDVGFWPIFSGQPASGGDSVKPLVLGSYDPANPTVVNPSTGGNRPVLKVGANGGNPIWTVGSGIAAQSGNYCAIVGLDFYCHERDPFSATYVNPSTYDVLFAQIQATIGLASTIDWFLVEDCRFSFFGKVFDIDYPPDHTVVYNGIMIRRNIFYNSWSILTSGTADAADCYIANSIGTIFEENTHYKCGWNHDVTLSGGGSKGARVFSHSIYSTSYPPTSSTHYPSTFRGNIYSDDSTGENFRNGGTIFNNLFCRAPLFHNFGSLNFGTNTITYNVGIEVIDRSTPPDGVAPPSAVEGIRGFGDSNGTYSFVGNLTYDHNIICNAHGGNFSALQVYPYNGSVTNCVLYVCGDGGPPANTGATINWLTGGVWNFDPTHITTTGSPTPNFLNTAITMSGGTSSCLADVQTGAGGAITSIIVSFDNNSGGHFWSGSGYTGGGFAGGGDHITGTISGGTVSCYVNTVTSFPNPNTTGGNKIDTTGTSNPTTYNFPLHGGWSSGNPMGNNSLGAYASSIGLTGTGQALLNAVTGGNPTAAFSTWGQGQCRANWQYNLTAAAINSYIRAGFGMADPGGLTLSPTSLPNGTVGVSYSQTVTASGGTAPYTYSTSPSPIGPGFSAINSSTGAITGTPTTAGPLSFTITANDSASGTSGPQSYSITIASGGTITLSPSSLPNGTVGVSYNQTITASGGTGPYTFTSSPSPPFPGVTLSTGGVLSGTPTTASVGFSFTVTATDSLAASSSPTSYSVAVNAAAPPSTLMPSICM